jgi:hypothetical protein
MRFLIKSVGADVRRLIIFATVTVSASLRRLLRTRVQTLAAFLAFTSLAQAQNAPHIGYVYPAGGRQGTTFQVTVGGQFPSGITNFAVVMDGDLAPAKVIAYDRPLRPNEQQAL